MKHITFFLLIILTNLPIINYSQNPDKKLHFFFGSTNDRLFYNGYEYMCSESPLSFFSGYEVLYSDKLECLVNYDSPITDDKNYEIIWFITDSLLYLTNVQFICSPRDTNNHNPTRFNAIEKLTRKKMKEPSFTVPEDINNHITPKGVLLADWFSDTLYIKKMPDSGKYDSDFNKKSFIRLIFRKGRIIQYNDVEGMTYKSKDPGFTLNISNNNPNAQTQKRTNKNGFRGNTNDIIYIFHNKHMCSSSPLSSFENYKDLYKEADSCKRRIMLPIDDDKNYEAIWILEDSALYLLDIQLFCDNNKHLNENPVRFEPLKKLTGVSMEPPPFKNIPDYIGKGLQGVMPAKWFSGTIYVKLYLLPYDGYFGSHLEKSPFVRYDFKNGKVINIDTNIKEMPTQ